MGRVKLPISRIVNNTNRQVTFSKRRNGILKKAYELAVLCDIDIALIMISPSGRISLFSGTRRIEDVMLQYFNFKDEERESDQDSEGIVYDREFVISTLMRLKSEEAATQSSDVLSLQAQEYKEEIMNLQHQLELAKQQLKVLEPEPQKFTSLGELKSCEDRLSEALRLVEKRKRHLLTDHSSTYQETVEQINTVVQYITNAHTEGNTSSLENPEFNSWVEHGQKLDMDGSNCVPIPSEGCTSSIFLRNQSSNHEVLNSISSQQNGVNDHHRENAEGFDHQYSNLNDHQDCPPEWHHSTEPFPAPMRQKISVSLNGMQSPTPVSITPSQHTDQFASPCSLPPNDQEDAKYKTKME